MLPRTIEFAQKLADTVSPTSMAAMKQQLWTHPLMEHEEVRGLSRSRALCLQSGGARMPPSAVWGALGFVHSRPKHKARR